ncbi:hypothetical protein CAMGR0001_0527 [Campylobacter gracilis RM3268]|uniref:Uncharacterized protein n=1 Tax=Campylobacter gracilis RM3268 TaxID=553220 RepID=C8PHT1_9BACT|nr:hypothetical protein CAMGR0001_0527 [Campylobacter gracilis RM3268]
MEFLCRLVKICAGAQNSCQNFVQNPYSFAREAIRARSLRTGAHGGFKKTRRRSFHFSKNSFFAKPMPISRGLNFA